MTYSKMTTAQLWSEFRQGLSQTSDGLLRMAKVWVELQNRGEDLSAYKSPMLTYLPDVAAGKLLPEMLLRFGSCYGVLEQVATLTPEDQRRISSGDGRVEVVESGGTVAKARIADLTMTKLRQVIGDGRVRTVAEQRKVMPKPSLSAAPIALEPGPFDLFAALDSKQVNDIRERSAKLGLSPAQYAVRIMVGHKALRDRVMKVTPEVRDTLAKAMRRTA